jgi:hypothetical protein
VATSFELVLRPVIDLAASVGDRRVVATGVGDGDRLVALLGSVTPGAPVDPSEPFIPGGEHDPRVLLMSALFADGQSKSVVELQVEPFTLAFPVVQPLSDGGLLVADSRVAVGKPPNGYVIGPDGKVRHSITFGDGIEHLLVDRVGRVWVGYFDEGVFGNLGWGNPGSPEPIGSPGLLRFDLATGEIEWAFKPPEGSDSIADCYALNVDGDHAWMSYYTDFDLFRVDSDGGTRRWRVGARGPGAVACATDDRPSSSGGTTAGCQQPFGTSATTPHRSKACAPPTRRRLSQSGRHVGTRARPPRSTRVNVVLG